MDKRVVHIEESGCALIAFDTWNGLREHTGTASGIFGTSYTAKSRSQFFAADVVDFAESFQCIGSRCSTSFLLCFVIERSENYLLEEVADVTLRGRKVTQHVDGEGGAVVGTELTHGTKISFHGVCNRHPLSEALVE